MAKKYFVDTSSLIDLLEDYLPSAANEKLYNKIQTAFVDGTCILLESVRGELRNKEVNGILVLERLSFLKHKEGKVKAQGNIDIPKEIYEKIDPDWIAESTQWKLANGKLDKAIFIKEKDLMVKGADFQLIFAAMQYNGALNAPADGGLFSDIKNNDGILVTEENSKADGKRFKKIPQIANIEGIECINLLEMLNRI